MIEGPRAAKKEELKDVVALSNLVFRSRGGDMGREYPTLFCPENVENLRIFLDEGRPISLIGFTIRDTYIMGATVRVCNIGSVCTHPDYRNRGYATRLLEDTVRKSLGDGVVLMLISGGRGLYRRIGCINAGIYHVYRFSKGMNFPRIPVQVETWKAEDISDLVRVHQSEPVRYIRDGDEFLTLLRAEMLVDRPADTWTVKLEGEIVAYICVQRPVEEEGVKILRAREIAGSRAAILAALPSLFDRYGVERIDLDAVGTDWEMRTLGKVIGAHPSTRGFLGTLKIINLKGFFVSIEPYISERLTEEELWNLEVEFEPELTFRYRDEEFKLSSDQDVTAFIFGSIERERPTPQTPNLSKILGKLFPMPLVDYGLNYI